MESSDWVKLLVPVFSNLFITSVFAVYFRGYLDKKTKVIEKNSQYMLLVMSNLKDQILNLEHHIINLQTGIANGDTENIKKLFLLGGDIQVYVEDYRTYFENIKNKMKTDVFELNKLDELIREFENCGFAVQKSSLDESSILQFKKSVDCILNICNKIVQSYNLYLSNL